jgi:hypothetical protein
VRRRKAAERRVAESARPSLRHCEEARQLGWLTSQPSPRKIEKKTSARGPTSTGQSTMRCLGRDIILEASQHVSI